MKRAFSAGLAIAAIAALSPAQAIERGMVIAGGELDPAIPGADVYLTTPAIAAPPAGKACALAARYTDLVTAGKAEEVANLYADDAIILEPSRENVRGIAEIREFYRVRLSTMQPQIVGVAYTGDEHDCMVALAAKRQMQGQTRYVLVSVDHFTLGEDGKAIRMVAFARPPRR
jgi:ketosteroid isomerase-like protein